MKIIGRAAGSILFAVLLFVQPVSAASSLIVQNVTREVNGPHLKYKCSYPRLTGIGDDKARHKINAQFRERAETARALAELASRRLDSTQAMVQGEFSYDVKRNGNGILSVAMNEKLSAGSERSIDNRTALTVDTVSGKVLKLGDFFIENADYRSMISSEIKKQISERKLETKLIEPFRQIRFNEEFYLTGDSIAVVFQQYEYFPYECGIQEFKIPLQSLDGILKPDYRPC